MNLGSADKVSLSAAGGPPFTPAANKKAAIPVAA